MKAIVQDIYGSADVLEFRDIDPPVVGPDDVLVRVHAAGCGPDVWHLMTGMPYMARLAIGFRRPKVRVPGWDVAGTVEAVGANVTGFRPGDEVIGTGKGSFAELVLAEPETLINQPGEPEVLSKQPRSRSPAPPPCGPCVTRGGCSRARPY